MRKNSGGEWHRQHLHSSFLEPPVNKIRFWLSSASALTVMAGGALLVTPTPAAATFACSSNQVTYVRSVITDVCGSDGGTAIVACDGADVDFVSVTCN
jgi:hypothetical protein